jgi:hypothetical protein
MPDFSEVIVYFGKHKGKAIGEIPSGYLKWLANNADDDEIAEAADQEYDWRTTHNQHQWD